MSYDYNIFAGATWNPVFRYASSTLVSKAITGITKAAPMVVTAVGHSLPDGWPAAVVSAGGMTQANATRYPPQGLDWKAGTVLTTDTVAFNKVNSSDYTAYTSGGFLVYYTPADLSTVTACVLNIYDNPEHTGTPLATLSIGSGIALDNVAKTITGTLATAALTWTTGYYELLVTLATGRIVQLLKGTITIES